MTSTFSCACPQSTNTRAQLASTTESSILKGTHSFLLGQPAISLGGLQRPAESPYALDIVPWSRPVRAATGVVPGVQLSSPVRLTVYPVAGFELVSGLIDLRKGVFTNRGTQGENIALPGPDVELDVNVTMRVLRPYPHSRVILVAQDPNGALLKVSEVDNRMSPSNAPFEMGFSTVTPFFDTTGNYTFYLMAETPVDDATLGGAGLPGYSEPTTPGYGWVKIGTVTFLFRGEGDERVKVQGEGSAQSAPAGHPGMPSSAACCSGTSPNGA